MLGGTRDAPRAGTLADAVVSTWTETMGTLADGRTVRLGASCLVLPWPGGFLVQPVATSPGGKATLTPSAPSAVARGK